MFRSIVRATLLVGCVASVTQAQVGGIINRAKQKAEDAAKKNSNVNTLPGDPVDANALNSLLKGLTIESTSRAQIQQLETSRDQKNVEQSKLVDANRSAWQQFDRDEQKNRNCIGDQMEAISEKHQADQQQVAMKMMGDPAAMQKLTQAATAYAQNYTKLLQKGDTTGAKKLELDYMKAMGIDVMADSAAAKAKCGKPPVKPAGIVKADSIGKEISNLNEQIRKIEQQSATQAVSASGMSADKYGQAKERLLTWYQAKHGGSSDTKVTGNEDALFKSRSADIEKVSRVLK